VLTGVRALASVRRRARCRASPLQATALTPLSSGAGARSCSGAGASPGASPGAGAGAGASASTSTSASASARAAELALDERERRLAVLGAVALVCVGIAAVAAIRVGGVAVGLDVGGVRALEASRTRSELRKAHSVRTQGRIKTKGTQTESALQLGQERLTPDAWQVPTL
jgi:hypothetical protein